MTETTLKDLESTLGEIKTGVETEFGLIKEDRTKVAAQEKQIGDIQKELNELRRQQLASGKGQRTPVRRLPNGDYEVGEDCARHLTGLLLCAAQRQGKMDNLSLGQRDWINGTAKDILGEHVKTALSSSDIPLPVEYSGQVAELVSAYGAARRYGTVFPLGTGSVKLPRLKTDTTFTLLSQATAITEKSPQTEWVTFTPEKFGGLIRLPTELDEDSIVPIGQFIARYAARQMARSEDTNFWVGTGAASTVYGTAEGCTKLVATNSKTTVSGTLGSPSEFTLAHIRKLRSVVDAPAIGMGAYYMHPTFEQHLSGLNTGGDKPYIANGINGASLDGFPIRWVDVMPVWTTSDALSTVHILFGDVSFIYLGVRGGIRFQTSVDAGFATDETLIRALERFTVGCMATGALAGLITHSA